MSKNTIIIVFLFALVAACGGGGGSTTAPTDNHLVAIAGLDRDILVNTSTLLVGDVDGVSDKTGLTYSWSLLQVPAGSQPTLLSDGAAEAYLTPDFTGVYVIALTVENQAGDVAYDEVLLTSIEEEPTSKKFPNAEKTVVSQTADGGYVTTKVQPPAPNEALCDFIISRFDWEGNLLWERAFGENWFRTDLRIKELQNGNLQIIGTTFSATNGADFFATQFSNKGEYLWQFRQGGNGAEQVLTWTEIGDNEILLAGYASTPNTLNGEDILLVKLDMDGELIWSRQINLGYRVNVRSVIELSSGNIALTGERYVYNGPGYFDTYGLLLAKMDGMGEPIWANVYDGPFDATGDTGRGVLELSDGSIVVAGNTFNPGNMSYDGLLMKTDPEGALLWAQTYGGGDLDMFTSLQEAHDGGYIISGKSQSYDLPEGSFSSAWVVRANDQGEELWSDVYLGASNVDVELTSDGFLFKGYLGASDRLPVWIRTDFDGYIYPFVEVPEIGEEIN